MTLTYMPPPGVRFRDPMISGIGAPAPAPRKPAAAEPSQQVVRAPVGGGIALPELDHQPPSTRPYPPKDRLITSPVDLLGPNRFWGCIRWRPVVVGYHTISVCINGKTYTIRVPIYKWVECPRPKPGRPPITKLPSPQPPEWKPTPPFSPLPNPIDRLPIGPPIDRNPFPWTPVQGCPAPQFSPVTPRPGASLDHLIGRHYSETGAQRVHDGKTLFTQEFNPSRLNVAVDAHGIVTRAWYA